LITTIMQNAMMMLSILFFVRGQSSEEDGVN